MHYLSVICILEKEDIFEELEFKFRMERSCLTLLS